MFTVGNIPNLEEKRVKQGDEFLQHVLVKTLLKVSTVEFRQVFQRSQKESKNVQGSF